MRQLWCAKCGDDHEWTIHTVNICTKCGNRKFVTNKIDVEKGEHSFPFVITKDDKWFLRSIRVSLD